MSVTSENQVFNALTHQPPKYDISGRLVILNFKNKKIHFY